MLGKREVTKPKAAASSSPVLTRRVCFVSPASSRRLRLPPCADSSSPVSSTPRPLRLLRPHSSGRYSSSGAAPSPATVDTAASPPRSSTSPRSRPPSPPRSSTLHGHAQVAEETGSGSGGIRMIDDTYEFAAPQFFDFINAETHEDKLKAEL
ncbi:hypothetical protein RIF29_30064 [Crotalaria pallida]|uniref:Uncharacterized protein n=1 Tax=Crotalaria pallida TaxID=3830 RepID=A0AAN9EHS7_CROPI